MKAFATTLPLTLRQLICAHIVSSAAPEKCYSRLLDRLGNLRSNHATLQATLLSEEGPSVIHDNITFRFKGSSQRRPAIDGIHTLGSGATAVRDGGLGLPDFVWKTTKVRNKTGLLLIF
jgi:hypothetical protein